MYPKALSICVIFLAVLGQVHGAPNENEEDNFPSLFPRHYRYHSPAYSTITLYYLDDEGYDKRNLHTFHIGAQVGVGTSAYIYSVISHDLPGVGTILLKHFHSLNATQWPARHIAEIKALKRVRQLAFAGQQQDIYFIFMHVLPGKKLDETNAMRSAKSMWTTNSCDRVLEVKQEALKLARRERLRCATEYGMLHQDFALSNMIFAEDGKGKLFRAYLIDWGNATEIGHRVLTTDFMNQILERNDTILRVPYP